MDEEGVVTVEKRFDGLAQINKQLNKHGLHKSSAPVPATKKENNFPDKAALILERAASLTMLGKKVGAFQFNKGIEFRQPVQTPIPAAVKQFLEIARHSELPLVVTVPPSELSVVVANGEKRMVYKIGENGNLLGVGQVGGGGSWEDSAYLVNPDYEDFNSLLDIVESELTSLDVNSGAA